LYHSLVDSHVKDSKKKLYQSSKYFSPGTNCSSPFKESDYKSIPNQNPIVYSSGSDECLNKVSLKEYEYKIDQLLKQSEIRIEDNSFDVNKIDNEMDCIKKDLDENKIVKRSI